ncbi:hypothetical protein GCM10025857_21660 [Alicyclobacillus contaminans]|uniref:hypothetical protein n=1 Tax=Alicyclobacillus contaminans TaxID=392016 RepID=UPI00040730CB|nr:hypothetical protein [Alicyclobacillus contaminans]GMA50809.1 hypothetical protein GCM10025857_21660 [Alicyclobacillus contaminans]
MSKPVKRTAKKHRVRVAKPSPAPVQQEPVVAETTSAPSGKPLDTLKQNLSGKRRAIFEILDDVKKVRPEQWQDPNQVEQLAKTFAGKLGLPVPEQRIKQFVNAYKDATKNGPNANVDELVKKYGKNVDSETLNQIKKFVPKAKG